MPYVVRVEQHGKEVKEDRYYTPCQRKKKSPPGSGRRNETILPGIYDEAAPTRSALPMQNNSGLAGRDYVAVHGVSRLEQRRRKQEAGRVRRTAP